MLGWISRTFVGASRDGQGLIRQDIFNCCFVLRPSRGKIRAAAAEGHRRDSPDRSSYYSTDIHNAGSAPVHVPGRWLVLSCLDRPMCGSEYRILETPLGLDAARPYSSRWVQDDGLWRAELSANGNWRRALTSKPHPTPRHKLEQRCGPRYQSFLRPTPVFLLCFRTLCDSHSPATWGTPHRLGEIPLYDETKTKHLYTHYLLRYVEKLHIFGGG
ncbi:hypothetical protein F4801DRAFT_479204 [Xylaria longipes]|nr:hypothetical protein F4801DRAFT_479204 [Xylaria longipes]